MKAPKIIILCGGKGSRLKPFTNHMPKPLVPLNGQPILKHIIESYQKQNLNNFILCTGYRSQDIEAFIHASNFKAEIEISNMGLNASILSRLNKVKHLIEDRAIITYGDTYIDMRAQDAVSFHLNQNVLGTITTANIQSPFGIIETTKTGKLISFKEKPIFSYYIGNFILEKKAFDLMTPKLLEEKDGDGLVSFFDVLIRKNKICAYTHNGLQLTFNTMDEHRKAEEHFIKFFTDIEQ